MKIIEFRTLSLLFASVLLTLLSGCNGDNGVVVVMEPEEVVPPEFVRVERGSEQVAVNKGEITNIVFFSNWIVMSSRFEIRIYDVNDPKNLRALFNGHPGIVEALALTQSSGKSFIAAGCSNGTIRCWDAEKVRGDIVDTEEKRKEGILVFTGRNTDYYREYQGDFWGQVISFSLHRQRSSCEFTQGLSCEVME